MNHSGYALVLSGGGAKGIYHIGAWKALRELGINIDAVIGNSVGALVAGFIAQGDYGIAEKALEDIDLRRIIDIPEELIRDGRFIISRNTLKKLDSLRESVIKHKGLDTAPLKSFLERYLDEGKIRKRGIDLGIITFNLDEFKPMELFIEQLEEGLLLDYLQASATFPGFKATKIKKKHYIDGGVYNNMPYSMAKERGYRKIIVVDISGIGFARKPDITCTRTVYIKNSIQLGGIFDFSKEFFTRFKLLGYLDTLRTFDKIKGIRYFYDEDVGLCKKLESRLHDSKEIKDYIDQIAGKQDSEKTSPVHVRIRMLLPKEYRHYRQIIHPLAECAALALNLERIQHRSFKEFVDEIGQQYGQTEKEINELKERFDKKDLSRLGKEIINITKTIDINTFFNASVYKYDRILEEILRPRGGRVPFSSLSVFFPFLPGARIFFKLIEAGG